MTSNYNTSPSKKVVVNPYARKRQKPSSSSTPSAALNTANAPSLHQNRFLNHHRNQYQKYPPGSVNHRPPSIGNVYHSRTNGSPSSAIGAPGVAANQASGRFSNPQPSNANTFTAQQDSSAISSSKRDSFDSLDNDIDWDEACRVADDASASLSQSQESYMYEDSQSTNGSSSPAKEHQPFAQGSSPVVDLTLQDEQPSNLSSQAGNSNGIVASPSYKKPPRVPSVGRQHAQNMQSLRPASWSSNINNNQGQGYSGRMDQKVPAAASLSSSPSQPQLSQQELTRQGKVVSSPAPKLHNIMSMLPKELRFSPDVVQPAKDGKTPELIKHARLSQPLANGWTLYDHQRRAICMGLRMRRLIAALDMGLGKTLIGCCWARSFQKTFPKCKVIVIAPVSLKEEWTRTAVNATEIVVKSEEKKSKTKKRKAKGQAPGEEEPSNASRNGDGDGDTPMMEIFSWAKVPTDVERSVESYVVVCDEAHQLQSMTAARTKDLLKLVQPQRCVGVLLLTGTPMKNGKPCNLFPLLRAVRHPLGNHQRAYELQFCNGRQKQFGRGPPVWDASGSSNLPQLRELVASHLLHLKKEDVLKSLPKSTREHVHVPVSQRQRMKYDTQLKTVLDMFAGHGNDSDKGEALLGQLQNLRYQGAISRVDACVEIARKVLSKEPSIVLFTTFVRVAKALQEKLESLGFRGELLTGETPPKKRQPMVDNFQQGISPVIVCTYGAGGVGLTLTAARTVILVDRPWTPGDVNQAEDRVRRIGQRHPVKFIWVSSCDVDKQIDAMLESKKQTSNEVLANGGDFGGDSAAPKVTMFDLLKRLHAQQTASARVPA